MELRVENVKNVELLRWLVENQYLYDIQFSSEKVKKRVYLEEKKGEKSSRKRRVKKNSEGESIDTISREIFQEEKKSKFMDIPKDIGSIKVGKYKIIYSYIVFYIGMKVNQNYYLISIKYS